ncbi:TonB-dependent receptor [Bryobacter aggregatus]|uniref:TonB-dependent receptor n=1 Tax=Bryobacter aggregatus TaxID=360054 RepID=UPI0004E1EC28|nr:TonB-dependent receptor [Bryobacter aggregatus]
MTAISNGSDSFIQYQPRNSYTTRAGTAYTHGSHTIKAGVDWRILNFNEGQNTQPSGTFNFARTFTQGPNPNQSSQTGGFGFADLLLGTPNSGSIRQLMPISTGGRYYAFYFQDDWRVTSKLTLNIGVRYDIGTGNSEKYNRLAYFDPNTISPLAGPAGLPNLRGVLQWIGGSNPSYTQATPKLNFAPRFGLAYKIGPNGVLRAGYGMFYIPRNIQGNGQGAVAAFRDTPMNTTIDGGLTPVDKISNPFPNGILPALNNRDPLTNVGASIQAATHDFKTGYTQLFSIGYQHQLPGQILVQANYWGNKGTSLLTSSWNLNQLPNQYLALGTQLNDQVTNPFFGLIASGGLSGRTISRRQSLLPYPQYFGDSGVQQVLVPAGNTSYHAGTLQADKRLTGGFTLMASYTWSKAIDDISTPIDFYNRKLNKALSGFDTPHMFVGSWVYQLPFGKGRRFGNSMHRVSNAILGGWDWSGIARIQSGQPISVSTPSLNLGRSAKLDNPSIAKWFDTSAFTNAQAFTFGNMGPRVPDVRNDFIIGIFGREITTQFRAECYNVTNTVQFAAPNGSVTSQSFGVVTAQRNTPRQFQAGLKIRF